jgi:hypothetical protein
MIASGRHNVPARRRIPRGLVPPCMVPAAALVVRGPPLIDDGPGVRCRHSRRGSDGRVVRHGLFVHDRVAGAIDDGPRICDMTTTSG